MTSQNIQVLDLGVPLLSNHRHFRPVYSSRHSILNIPTANGDVNIHVFDKSKYIILIKTPQRIYFQGTDNIFKYHSLQNIITFSKLRKFFSSHSKLGAIRGLPSWCCEQKVLILSNHQAPKSYLKIMLWEQ